MTKNKICTLCNRNPTIISELNTPSYKPIIDTIQTDHPEWNPEQSICLKCLDHHHQQVLAVLMNIEKNEGYTALSTPIRLNSHPSYSGKGVSICFIDSGFFLHPDLIFPTNRIKHIEDITHPGRTIDYFKKPNDNAWHGTMTSVVCAGSGYLSNGVYKGVANNAEIVLLKVMDDQQKIFEKNIVKALNWIKENHEKFNIRIVNLSVTGDEEVSYHESEIDQLIKSLYEIGIIVVAAVGNDTSARILPPANSLEVIAVGGLDDHNTLDPLQRELYHSTFGYTIDGLTKPELIAPSMWLAAPILPETKASEEAFSLFKQLKNPEEKEKVLNQIKSKKIISPHYQLADGTSFAAPIVCSVIAQMLEANPKLSPQMIREILFKTARLIPSTDVLRQGYGVIQAGHAVLQAAKETNHKWMNTNPVIDYSKNKITFRFHDHLARQVFLTGDFVEWQPESISLSEKEDALWEVEIPLLSKGIYQYKFVVNNKDWIIDPLNYFRYPNEYNSFNSLFFIDKP